MSARSHIASAVEPDSGPTNTGSYDPDWTPSEYFVRREHLGRPWGEHWCRFERDMRKLGLVVHECHGRNGWGGPAVTIPAEQLSDVVTATRVKLDTHEVGGCVMAYPAPVWI